MKKMLCIFVLVCSAIGGLFATALSEGFGNLTFPPAGWNLINGGNTVTWQHSTSFQHNAYGSAIIGNAGSVAHNDWLITPQLSPSTGDATFSFWAANWWTTFERFNVKLSTTTNNQADFTVTLASNVGPNGWTQYSYNLTAYIGQPVFIAIQAISANTSIAALIIDDVTGPAMTGYEGFETNNFSAFNWSNSSPSPWTVQSTDIYSGSYAARSGAIENDNSTSLILTQSDLAEGTISFYKKVSSEENYDYLKFYIDDVEKGAWSGENDWTMQSYAVTAGSHTFRWTYQKDYIDFTGSDCAWIDGIILPPIIYGSVASPYLIYDFNQLYNVRNYLGATHSGKNFKLMSDIDASPTSTTSWVPIGNNVNYFYGNFDGNGHTISNLRCAYYGNYHGLFGISGVGSVIKNLVLASTCYVLGDTETGSIVGRNNGTVQNCSSAAEVRIGNAEAGGGLVGYNTGTGTITGSSFSGSVTRSGGAVNSNKLGGIAGSIEAGAIINDCYSSGTIAGSTWCGGLVGWNNGTVNRSFSTGSVSGYGNSIGGLVGQHNGTITNSYSRAAVSGASYIGGLVGFNSASTITNSYATGTVTGSQKGGLSGQTGATITNSYWDTQTSGMATSYGGTGKTTAQMNTQSTFTGWDFTRETINGTSDYWTIWPSDNNGYPELFWKHANELREPVLSYPAYAASALPLSGFNLTWIPNSAGQAPVSYTIYMVLGDLAHLYDSAFAGQHTFSGISGTSFDPVATGGITFNSGEQWYWSVKAQFAGGAYSVPSAVRYFITERNPFATESFELGNMDDSNNIFEWTQVYGYGYSQWQANRSQTSYNRSPRTGNWNLTMYYAADYFSFGWLFHPYPLVGGVTYDAELFARQYTDMNGNALIGMYFGTSPTEAAMTTEITPEYMVQTINGDYQRVAGSFTPSTSGTYYLGIRNRVAGFIYYMSLDDVSVTPRVVPNPVTLVSPVNQAVGQSLLPTLRWTPAATGGIPTQYKLYFQASSTPIVPTTLLTTLAFGTNAYTFTEPLDQNTSYYWMVVPTNAIGDAVASTVYSFKTLLPNLLYETFGTSVASDLPANWTTFTGELSDPSNLTPEMFTWFRNYWANVFTSPANISPYFGFFSNHQEWLVTPALDLGGAPYQLQFDIALTARESSNPITSNPNGSSGIDDRFVILIGDGSSWTSANILREWNNSGSPYVLNDVPNTGMQVTIPLSAYTGTQYIAFYGSSTESNAVNDFFVDNVHVYVPYSHNLAALNLSGQTTGPIGIPVSHTVTVANFGSEPETAYTVNLKSLSPAVTLATLNVSTPLAAGATATHSLIWTPVSPGIESEIYAEIVLATDQEPINNVSPNLLFYSHLQGTLCEGFEAGIPPNWTVLNADGGSYTWDYTSYSGHTGTNMAYSTTDGSLPSDDWLITPPLQLSNQSTDTVSFWISGSVSGCQEEWEVLVSTTDTQPASFTMIDSRVITSGNYIMYSYNLDAYGDAVIYFAVRYRSSPYTGNAVLIDDFRGPLIYVPTALSTPMLSASLTGSTVNLSWNAINGATEYHIYASDNPYLWPSTYSIVPSNLLHYSYDASSVAGKFFKVVAYYGRSQIISNSKTLAEKDNSRLEVQKARLKGMRQ